MQATGDPVTWRKRTHDGQAQGQVRAIPERLSPEEKDILAATEEHYSRKFGDTWYKFVSDVMELIRNWPQFFPSRELCGEKMHAALLSVASHLLLLSALLAGVSITPLNSPPPNISDVHTRAHGALWSLLLMFNLATLGASALFLFHLLGCPPQLGWVWTCNIGPPLITISLLLMSLSAVLTFVALSCTTWFIYGRVVGGLTSVVSVMFVLSGFTLAVLIGARHIKTLNTGSVDPPQKSQNTQVVNTGVPSTPSQAGSSQVTQAPQGGSVQATQATGSVQASQAGAVQAPQAVSTIP